MIYSLKISEKYDVDNCIYYYQCAINANLEAEALAKLVCLDTIVQKAFAANRLDNESKDIIFFIAQYPDLLEEAKKFGVGLDDLVLKAYEQKPYGPEAAAVIRMAYD